MEPKACLTEATYKCEFSLIQRDFFQEIPDVLVKVLLDKYRRHKENRKKNYSGTHRNNIQSFPSRPILQLESLCATRLQLIGVNVRISFSLAYRSGVSCFAFYRPAKGDEKRPGSVRYFSYAFPRPACLALYARFVLRLLKKCETIAPVLHATFSESKQVTTYMVYNTICFFCSHFVW